MRYLDQAPPDAQITLLKALIKVLKAYNDHVKMEMLISKPNGEIVQNLPLKELLSPISLEPVLNPDNDFYSVVNAQEGRFKPYYLAHIKTKTLALLDERNKGSNWFQWRGRWDSNPRSLDRQSRDLSQANRRPHAYILNSDYK